MVFQISAVAGLIADALYRVGAVKFGEFRLKVHRTQPELPLSPYFFDCRGSGHPTKPGPVPDWLVSVIAAQMVALFHEDEFAAFDAVAAVPEGATPYGETVAALLGVPLIRLRKIAHADGTTTVDGIEGDPEAFRGKRVLLIEDVVTTAASSGEAISVLSAFGIVVVAAACVVDREQGGTERLASLGIRLRPLFTFTALVGHFRARDTIDAAKYATCHAYHSSSGTSLTLSP